MNEQVDWNTALASVNGDGSLLKLVIEAFLQECVELQGQIAAAIDGNDPELLQRGGHTLKGGMLSLGAQAWSEPARELEKLGSTGTTEGAQDLADRLNRSIPSLLEQLRAFSVEQDD